MAQKVRWGVIGAGGIADRRTIPGMMLCDNAELVAVMEINMELAQECISELLGGAEPVSVTVDKIFSAVFNKYGISRESLTGNKRNKDIANTRHITIYLIRELTEMSFPSIAKIFERDHSTIISSHRLMETKLLEDPAFLSEINELKKEI